MAVRQNGEALEYASKALKNDREIALAAIIQNNLAFEFLSEAMKKDPIILAERIKHIR